MNKQSILVIAAHPDDEILGCGGTIAKHVENGDIVNVLIAATGLTARGNLSSTADKSGSAELESLKKTCIKANKHLGVSAVEFLDLPDNRMDSLDLLDIVKRIEETGKKLNPSCVYTHSLSDLNIDHKLLSTAVRTAFRPLPETTVKRILTFEVLSATGWEYGEAIFKPNIFINIEKQLERKMQALHFYESEMRDFPHARSYEAVKSLATYRGAIAGVSAAEAFELVRETII